MKIFSYLISLCTLSLLFNSCIRDEALNSEADINSCILPKEFLTEKEIIYNSPYDSNQEAYPLDIEVTDETDLSSLSPEFILTPGATIDPESGSTHDFSYPVYYTVTSEDGKWKRKYAVSIYHSSKLDMPTSFNFETFETSKKYYTFYEEQEGKERLTWASGNQGFSLTASNSTMDKYPTVVENNGYEGKCLKLVTRSTGWLGSLANKPIAAGNLFIGSFNIGSAMGDALSSTKFGHTFHYKPIKLTGYYKYKAGPKYWNGSKYIDQKDIFNIYGLFFEKSKDTQMLDGHLPENNFQNSNMVALALIKDAKESDEWTYFEIPFDYERYGKEISQSKLTQGIYSISIVMSSSIDGDTFKGSPESTLLVDNLRIEY